MEMGLREPEQQPSVVERPHDYKLESLEPPVNPCFILKLHSVGLFTPICGTAGNTYARWERNAGIAQNILNILAGIFVRNLLPTPAFELEGSQFRVLQPEDD